MKSMLDTATTGRMVIAYAGGKYAPQNKNSNLYKAIIASGYTPDDIGHSIDVVVGARRRRRTEGWKMAIVAI